MNVLTRKCSGFHLSVIAAMAMLMLALGYTTPAAAQAMPAVAAEALLSKHVDQLRSLGKAPQTFVLDRLKDHDLVVFDDGVHTAADPFAFYVDLVASAEFQKLAPSIFLEVIPSNRQRALDAYLRSLPENPALLYPAFQDDFGWAYQSYFDLLHAIHVANRGLPKEHSIHVVAVSTPSLWGEIKSIEDWNYKVDTAPLARDYFMYALIRDGLDDFQSGRKGIFLTNSRHAYTRMKLPDGTPVRSTTAFFTMWHPGKAYSIRFDEPALLVHGRRHDTADAKTAAGMEDVEYTWTRVADGLWDEAFRAYGKGPVAVTLDDTVFGDAKYVGNLMLGVAPGQTMRDAYDAVIFLRDFDELRKTAVTDAIYTPDFKRELEHRYQLSQTPEQIATMLHESNAGSLHEYIEKEYSAQPAQPLHEAAVAGPIDAWRKKPQP